MITSNSFSPVALNNSSANIYHINFCGNVSFIDRINYIKTAFISNQEKCKKEFVYHIHKDIIDIIEYHKHELISMSIRPYLFAPDEYVDLANRLIKKLERYVKKISDVLDIMNSNLDDYVILKHSLNIIDIEYIKGN